jgi:ABC-type uncharacterized transport system permease subunit
MPVFALLALVAYSISLALIIPGLLQKNSSWRRMAILSAIALICHAFALESRIFPAAKAGKTSAIKRGIAGQPDDLYGDDHRGLA